MPRQKCRCVYDILREIKSCNGLNKMNMSKFKDELQIFWQISKEQSLTLPFVSVLFLSLTITVFFSVPLGVLLALFFIVGTYTSLRLVPLLHAVLLYENSAEVQKPIGCSVCGDPSCGRQRPVGEHQPWVGLDVPKEFDQALQDLYNKLINEFVGAWFGRFSKDDTFLWQIRERLRFASSILLRRIIKVEVGEVICERLLPIFLRHIDDFVLASDGCSNKDEKLATMVSHLGDRLHPAARSRHAELDYLRAVSQTLTRIGLYKEEQQCDAVSSFLTELLAGWVLLSLSDALCSPHNINTLFLLALQSDRLQPVTVTASHKVQFLKAFATRPAISNASPLRSDLSAVLHQQKLLFPVMQFLKRCSAVHLLQFCLDVEDFNKRLLVPDLSPTTSTDLYKEAWDLYSLYLKVDSPDFIHCSSSLPQQFHQVLSRGNADISRLQTSTPLFQAYEETYSLLEQTYLPAFYQSDLFFQMLCGEGQRNIGSAKLPQKRCHEPLVSKLSQRLQKFISGPTVDDTGLLVDNACDATDLDCEEVLGLDGELEFRDMARWKVTIPNVETTQRFNTRPFPVFTIRVVAEAEDETWVVQRKSDDFYILEARLMDFHRQLKQDLPPQKKGLFAPRGTEFLESQRQELENYLQKLVLLPQLRCSDLLHCFLRNSGDFQTAVSNPLPAFGVKRRAMAMKLRNYRGRHLEPFLISFMSSVESPSKTAKNDFAGEKKVEYEGKRTITHGLFEDNLANVLKTTSSWPPRPPKSLLMLTTFWDCLLYIMWRIIGSSTFLQRLVLVFKLLLGDAGSPLIHKFISRRLNEIILPRLPHHIRLLQSAILHPNKLVTSEQVLAVRSELDNKIHEYSNTIVGRVCAPQLAEGLTTVIDILQFPALNKHLFYLLFDEILRVLFSEISTPTAFNK